MAMSGARRYGQSKGREMNERLKELAEQAGFMVGYNADAQLERFAELVRQNEREACATECYRQMSLIPTQAWTINPYQQCMQAILARGEK